MERISQFKDKYRNRMIIDQYRYDTADPDFKASFNTALGTGNTIELPLRVGYTYDFYWTPYVGATPIHVTAYNDANRIYDYGTPTVGQFAIIGGGTCESLYFNFGGDKLKITSIDNWGNIIFTGLNSSFYGCTNLTSLPSSGSINFTGTTLSNIFRQTSLTNIPENTFNLCTNATDLEFGFYANTTLTTLPSNLFKYCISLTSIGNCFRSCTNLLSIPNGFLDNQINLTSVSRLFNGCTSLTALPNDLLRYCTILNNVSNMCDASTNLSGIPENLFYYNPLITNYSGVFLNVRNIVLPSVLFNLANISIVTTFNTFMSVSNVSYSATGTIQDIWTYATSATSVNAFLNQTSITNYASIPNAWKGL